MDELVLTRSRVREKIINPNVIIILGAGLLMNNHEIMPSVQTKNNVDKGVELILEYGKDVGLVFSGGFTLGSETESITMYKYFISKYINNLGIFYKEILLEIQSRNSYENIFYCLNLAEKNSWRSIIVIDQPMHIPQLKLLARKELQRRKLKIQLQFVSAKPVWGRNVQKQWSSPMTFFIYEILTTFYYLLKGKIL